MKKDGVGVYFYCVFLVVLCLAITDLYIVLFFLGGGVCVTFPVTGDSLTKDFEAVYVSILVCFFLEARAFLR